MANLIVFGVPSGFQTGICDKATEEFLMLFYRPWKPGTDFVVQRRRDDSVHYIFLVHENPGSVFSDVDGRGGSFFGLDLAFKNQYVTDSTKIEKLLQLLYDTYVKGQIIIEHPNGSRQHKFRNFVAGGDDFIGNYLVKGLKKLVNDYPELNFWPDVKPLTPVQDKKNVNAAKIDELDAATQKLREEIAELEKQKKNIEKQLADKYAQLENM